jgi:hypothetical protein
MGTTAAEMSRLLCAVAEQATLRVGDVKGGDGEAFLGATRVAATFLIPGLAIPRFRSLSRNSDLETSRYNQHWQQTILACTSLVLCTLEIWVSGSQSLYPVASVKAAATKTFSTSDLYCDLNIKLLWAITAHPQEPTQDGAEGWGEPGSLF